MKFEYMSMEDMLELLGLLEDDDSEHFSDRTTKIAEHKEAYLRLDSFYCSENYLLFQPYADKLDNRKSYSLRDCGVDIHIQRLSEFEIADYELIIGYSSGAEVIKVPWIKFVMDHDKKIAVPCYFQNDELHYYSHILDEKYVCDYAALNLADSQLHFSLLHLNELSTTNETFK